MVSAKKKGPDSALVKAMLSDGTELEFATDRIFSDGFKLEDSSSSSNSFDIGYTTMRVFTLSVMNFDEKYSLMNFENAYVKPFVINNGISYQRGRYHVHEPQNVGGRLTLTCYDDMYNLEKKIDVSAFTLPCTLGQAMNVVAVMCGIQLKSNTFSNSGLMLTELTDKITTYRQLAGYIAQCAGSVFRQNDTGLFEFCDYKKDIFKGSELDGGNFLNYDTGDEADGGNFSDYTSGYVADGGTFGDRADIGYLYELNSYTAATEDTVITEITIIVDDTEYKYGEPGYTLSIKDNPLIKANNVDIVMQLLKNKYIGMKFRQVSGKVRSDFRIDAMDPVYITDEKGRSYSCFITNVIYDVGNYSTISCDCENSDENKTSGNNTVTKLLGQASANTKEQVSKEAALREAAIEALAQQLVTSAGLFMTTVKQEDGSSIYYMHDKATLAESMIVWKLTANAFGVSTDGGKTYPYGLDATGTAILDRIYAIGIIADYILGGTIEGEIIAKNFKMQGGSIDVTTSSNTQDKIKILYHSDTYNTDWIAEISPLTFAMTNTGDNGDANNRIRCALQAGGLYFYEGSTDEGKSVYHKDGCRVGGKMHADGAIVSEDSIFGAVRVVAGKTTGYFSGTALSVYGSAIVNGDFTVTGSYSKNRAVETENNGTVLLSAYETSTPLFGDIGQGIIGEDGECRVYIDEIFRETVVLGSQYNVFIQKYGQGEAYVSERNSEYFVVNGTAGLSFAWEMKGVQKGLANCRLDSFERRTDTNDAFYEDRSYDYKADISDTDYSNVGYELITEYEKELIA